MTLFSQALLFATKAHGNQKRRNGNYYIIHPIRVAQEVRGEKQKAIALLHDVLEDTSVTLLEVSQLFGSEVAEAVECLTKRKGETYDDYISRVLTNKDAVAVKIADICDNLGDSPGDEAIKKSSEAIVRLTSVTYSSYIGNTE